MAFKNTFPPGQFGNSARVDIALQGKRDRTAETIVGDTDDSPTPSPIPGPIAPKPLHNNQATDFKSIPEAGNLLSLGA